MNRKSIGLFSCAIVLIVVESLAHAAGAAQRASKDDADSLRQKVASISTLGERPVSTRRQTSVTENEVNSYLALDGQTLLPVGVVEPSVSILGPDQISARAVVDLDAVRKEKNPTSLFDPAYYLAGRLPVTATGVLRTSNGTARFELQSATVGGVPVPKIVLQEIVSYYSKTPENPSGIGLDDSFPLPSRIREIQVQRGQAIIVQ